MKTHIGPPENTPAANTRRIMSDARLYAGANAKRDWSYKPQRALPKPQPAGLAAYGEGVRQLKRMKAEAAELGRRLFLANLFKH